MYGVVKNDICIGERDVQMSLYYIVGLMTVHKMRYQQKIVLCCRLECLLSGIFLKKQC